MCRPYGAILENTICVWTKVANLQFESFTLLTRRERPIAHAVTASSANLSAPSPPHFGLLSIIWLLWSGGTLSPSIVSR